MKKILLRSRKGPFDVISPEVTLSNNAIGDNSGNLLFSHAVHRMLDTPETEVTSNRFRANPDDADKINEKYDLFVVPLANAFRLSFEDNLRRLAMLIERLTIPVVIFGVGAQGSLEYDASRLAPMADTVKRFAAAVLDRSPSIGVRGEFTLEYLNQLGFKDVDVIGCPSMFLHGDELRVTKRSETLTEDARLAINISPYVKRMKGVIDHHHRRYRNLTYVAQDLATLGLLLWGQNAVSPSKAEDMPVTTSHPLYREDRIRFFVDPMPWVSYLSDFEFSFGTRIHGNIAALVGGTPCHVLAHDSRTLELARYFDIPHSKLTDDTSTIDAAELYQSLDLTKLHSGHKARFATMLDFLQKHDVDHAFREGRDGGKAFDARVAETVYPEAVRALAHTGTEGLVDRVRWLKTRDDKQAKRIADLEAKVSALTAAAKKPAPAPAPRPNRLRRALRRVRG